MANGSVQAAPQDAGELNWYEVELLILSQPARAIDSELWDPSLEVKPLATQAMTLFSGQQADGAGSPASASPLPSVSPTATFPTNMALVSGAIAGQREHPAQKNPFLIDIHRNPERYQRGAFTQVSADPDYQPPWNLSAMQRRGYQLLYQARWRQPIPGREAAMPVWVQSEQRLSDNTPALQGTLTLYLSRYLHLRSDLYYSQELPVGWISMRPTPAVSDAPAASSASANAPSATSDNVSSDAVASAPTPTAPTPTAATPTAPPLPEHLNTNEAAPALEQGLLLPSQPNKLTIQLTQGRRMRSNELHYIDHPMLGVLLRLTPYTPPIETPADSSGQPLTSPANTLSEASSTATGKQID